MTRFLLLLLFAVSGFAPSLTAAVAAPPAAAVQETTTSTITRASLEAELGRKLNFRERLAVKFMARKQKKAARKSNSSKDGYSNGHAIAGFVLGVLALLGLSIIAGIPAIIFSAIGLRKANQEGLPHRGLAIAGLVCGIISVVFLLLLIALLAFAFSVQ